MEKFRNNFGAKYLIKDFSKTKMFFLLKLAPKVWDNIDKLLPKPLFYSLEEEEFLGELAEAGQDESVFKRDHVFVQLNFKLKCGKLQVENTNQFGSKNFTLDIQ